jgi:hypothetical protein
MNNANHIKNRGWTQVLAKDKQFLSLKIMVVHVLINLSTNNHSQL